MLLPIGWQWAIVHDSRTNPPLDKTKTSGQIPDKTTGQTPPHDKTSLIKLSDNPPPPPPPQQKPLTDPPTPTEPHDSPPDNIAVDKSHLYRIRLTNHSG